MADNFEPVGVRAVVQGAGKFIADMGRLEGSIRSFIATAQNIGITFANVSSSTVAAQQQLSGVSNVSLLAANSIRQLDSGVRTNMSTTQRYNAALGSQTAALSELSERISFLNLRNIENLNTQTRAIASSQSLSNQLVQLSAKYQELDGKLNSLKSGSQGIIQQLDRESRARENIHNSITKEENSYAKLSERLTSNEGKRKKLVGAINALNKEISEIEAKSGQETAQWERKNGVLGQTEAELQRNIAEYRRLTGEMQESRTTIAGYNQELVASAVKSREMANELNRMEAEANQVSMEMTELSNRINSLGRAKAAILALGDAFRRAASAAGTLANVALAPHRLFQSFGRVLGGISSKVDELSRNWFKMGNSIRFFGMSLVFFITIPIIGFLQQITKAAIDFEDAFAGVIKTVDGLVQEGSLTELNQQGLALRQGFRDMATEIPITAADLAGLGQIAGQLGVRGSDNILSFVDTVARLGVSTNLSAEDAATGMAQLVAVVGNLDDAELALAGFTASEIRNMSTSERFQNTVQTLGATLVGLGNKLPTTEADILRFSQRIAASGKLINITSGEIVGIAAAFASVGIPAERGGTAVQKTFKAIITAIQEGGTQLELFATLAGVTTQEFAAAFAEGSEIAGKTFAQFIIGLGKNKDKAVAILDELGLNNERVFNSLVTLSQAQDTAGKGQARIAEAMQIVNDEFQKAGVNIEDFNALQLESARRFETTSSKIQLMKNQFQDLGITLGSFILPELTKVVELLRQLIKRIGQFADTDAGKKVVQLAIAIGLVVAALGPAVIALGLFMSSIGFIGIAIGHVIGAFALLFSWFGLLAAPILAVGVALTGLAIAFIASMNQIGTSIGEAATGLIPRMWRFGKELILAFAKGMAQAIAAIIIVLNAIGKVISYWLSPGSPPRLLPDIDKWGAQTFTEYLKGWLEADFSVFNQLSSKLEELIRAFSPFDAEPQDIIPRILGTRKAIADAINLVKQTGKVTNEAVNKITRALGQQSTLVKNYAKALLEVGFAEDQLAAAQERLNAITERYAKILRPISDRLKQISARQEEVRREMRITELESILDDPRATELARELAGLEIEQIGLEAQTDQLESARDAELEVAQAQVDAAQAQLDAAQSQLKIAEEMLDISIRNRQLIVEMEKAADAAAKKLKESFDLSGLEGFDPSDLTGELDVPPLDFSDLDQSIDATIKNITDEIDLLIKDLEAIFAPLGPLWEDLGKTWAPIFERIGTALGGIFSGFFGDAFEGTLLPSDIAPFESYGEYVASAVAQGINPDTIDPMFSADDLLAPLDELEGKVMEFTDNVITTFGAFFVDLGIVEPFGPLVVAAEGLEDQGGQYLTSFGGRIDTLLNQLETFATSDDVKNIIKFGGELAQTFLSLSDSSSEARQDLQPVLDFFGKMFGIVAEFQKAGGRISLSFLTDTDFGVVGEAFSGAISQISDALGGLREALPPEIVEIINEMLTAFGGFIQFAPQIAMLISQIVASGIFTGFVEGLATVISGIGTIVSGVIHTLTALYQVGESIRYLIATTFGLIIGTFAAIVTGNFTIFEDVLQNWTGAVGDVLMNLGGVLFGILEIISGIFISVFGGIATFVVGFVQGVANSVGELGNLLPEKIGEMATAFSEAVTTWTSGALESIQGFIDDIVAIFQTLYDNLVGHSLIPNMLADIMEVFSTWFSDQLEALGGFIDDAVTWAGDLADGIISGLTDGLSAGSQAVLDAIGDLVGGAVDWAKGILGISSPSKEFTDVGTEAMTGLARGVEKQKAAVEKLMKALATNMLNLTKDFFEALIVMWEEGLVKTTNVYESWIEKIKVITQEFMLVMALRGAASLFGQLFEAILRLLDTFVTKFTSQFQDFVDGIRAFTKRLVEIWVQQQEVWHNLGVELINAFAQGLQDRAPYLYSVADRIADNIRDIINDALEVGSPSKFMIRVGESMMEGWAIGMMNLQGTVASTAASVASGAISAVEARASAPSRVARTPAPSPVLPAGASGNTFNTVEMGGQTINNGLDVLTLQILIEQALRNALQ